MKVHVKKVPKKRMTERKKMSGTYSQEWERTPMNLGRRRLCLREKKNCFKSFKIRRGSNPSQFAVLQSESIVVDVFSSTGPQFAAPLFGVVLIVCPAFDCFQAVVLCTEKIWIIPVWYIIEGFLSGWLYSSLEHLIELIQNSVVGGSTATVLLRCDLVKVKVHVHFEGLAHF